MNEPAGGFSVGPRRAVEDLGFANQHALCTARINLSVEEVKYKEVTPASSCRELQIDTPDEQLGQIRLLTKLNLKT